MKMNDVENFNNVKVNTKEKLELIDKRVEIQKKRLEIKKQKMELNKLGIETEKEQLDLIEKRVQIQVDLKNKREYDKMVNDKLFSVLFPLMMNTIDENRTILGSEPFYTPLLTGKNKETAMNKLMELINQL
jgi:hypothetical protein